MRESRSKNGLNRPFYDWLDEVRKAKRKIPELLEELDYLNVKLTSCKSISYDIEIHGTSGEPGDSLLYWIEKIQKAEEELENHKAKMKEYEDFIAIVTQEELCLLNLMDKGEKDTILSNSRSYRTKNKLIRKWQVYKISHNTLDV